MAGTNATVYTVVSAVPSRVAAKVFVQWRQYGRVCRGVLMRHALGWMRPILRHGGVAIYHRGQRITQRGAP